MVIKISLNIRCTKYVTGHYRYFVTKQLMMLCSDTCFGKASLKTGNDPVPET